MRRAGLIALLLCLASATLAQTIPPGVGFGVMPEARAQIDSMARATLVTRTEQARCVTTSMMRDSTFVIAVTSPAKHIAKSDSLHVYADGPLCEPWQQIVHTHFIDNPWFEIASPIDYQTAATRGVFGFLVSVKSDTTWTMRAYP